MERIKGIIKSDYKPINTGAYHKKINRGAYIHEVWLRVCKNHIEASSRTTSTLNGKTTFKEMKLYSVADYLKFMA